MERHTNVCIRGCAFLFLCSWRKQLKTVAKIWVLQPILGYICIYVCTYIYNRHYNGLANLLAPLKASFTLLNTVFVFRCSDSYCSFSVFLCNFLSAQTSIPPPSFLSSHPSRQTASFIACFVVYHTYPEFDWFIVYSLLLISSVVCSDLNYHLRFRHA